MKTKFNARVLSWVLAICMLIGIAPALPVESAQAAAGDSYVYSFCKSATTSLLVDALPDTVDGFDDVTEGQPWKFVNHTKTNFRNYSIGTTGLYVGASATTTTSIVLKLPEAGYYDVTAEMLAQAKSTGSNLTFTACDENGAPLAGATESIKYWVDGCGTAWTYPVSSVGKHYFDSEYILVKYNVHRIDGTYYSNYFRNLTFKKLALDIDVETPPAIAMGESAVLPVVASTVAASGKTAVALTAVSAESEIVDIALVDGSVVVTAKDFGTESVPVTFTAAGASETVNVVFSVYDALYNTDKTYTYNILKAGVPHANMESGDMNSYNMTTPGATGEINPQYASYPWKVLSASNYFGVVNLGNYGAMTNKMPNTIKYKFLLPENGIYNYYGKHATHSAYSAQAVVSLQKVGAAEGEEFYENTPIGTVSTATSRASWAWETLATDTNPDLALTAGEYILTWEVSDIKGGYFMFDGFEFVGQEGMNLEIEADDAIVSGTYASIPVSVSGATGDVEFTVEAPEGVDAYMDGDLLEVEASDYGVYTISVLAGDLAGKYGRKNITVMMMEGEPIADEYVYDFTFAKPEQEIPEGEEEVPLVNVGISAIEGLDEYDLSLQAGSAPWKYLSGDEGVLFQGPSFGYYAYYPGLVMYNTRTGTHALYKGYARNLVIYVPDSGTYDASFDIAANADGSQANVSLTPCDVDGVVAEGTSAINLDMIDFQSLPGDDTKSVVNPISKVTLDAGFYVLTVDLRKSNGNDFFAGINSFILTRDVTGISFDAPAPIKVDDSVEVALNANAPIMEVTVADNFIADIEVNETGDALIVTGVAAGSEVIDVEVWLESGVYKTISIPVNVYDDTLAAGGTEYIYNLLKATLSYKYNYVDSFNKTTSGATGEINPARFSAPWKVKAGAPDSWILTDPGYGTLINAVTGAGIVIRVPQSGNYKIIARYNGWEGSGMNLNTTITDADGVTTALEAVDTGAKSGALTAVIGEMELEAGDYTLDFSASASSSTGGGNLLGISGIILKVVDEDATATLSYPEVEIDGTAEPTLVVDTTAASYDIAYASDNEAVATVDPATGVVTGVSEGTAKITVTISGNAVCTAEYTVTVKAAEEEPKLNQGDINGDGRVNTRDVTNLRRYLAGGYEDEITVVEGMTDVNGDGRENTRDVAALRAIIAG